MAAEKSSLRRALAAVAAAAGLALTAPLVLPASSSAAETSSPDDATAREAAQLAAYGGDPEREGAIVADEDSRVVTVRTVKTLAKWDKATLEAPYRIKNGSGYTLILTRRDRPYTIDDLLNFAPKTFVRQPDGSYLLSENIVLHANATLQLEAPGGLVLRLASGTSGFVSLVSLGGRLEFKGTSQHPVTITSWDRNSGQPDMQTKDGRAYIRAQGGQFLMDHVNASNLGFWSGRTGGIALTGTDRPDTGQLKEMVDRVRGKDPEGEEPAADATAAGTEPEGAGDDPATAQGGGAGAPPATDTDLDGSVGSVGELTTPVLDFETPSASFISAEISNTTIKGNAFGLFVATAEGVQIRDTTIEESKVDGLVLHRDVRGSTVEGVTARRNNGDGVVINRAATGLVINESTSEGNLGNGFALSGRSLADGPSATGSPIGNYGNNSISNSIARDNGRYGIDIVGGVNIGIQGNRVVGNEMGIVARDGAKQVRIIGNEVAAQRRQGIAIRDGAEANATANVVTGGETGIYVRASAATVTRNTVTDVTSHGVTLKGEMLGSTVQANLLAGRGLSALDTARASGDFETASNSVSQWEDTSSLAKKLKRLLHPMTVIWIGVLSLIGATALRGRKARVERGRHPYSNQMSLHATPPVVGGGGRVIDLTRDVPHQEHRHHP